MQISADDSQIIKQILQQYLPIGSEVWLFGSRAKNNAKKFSDLDLAIQSPDSMLSLETLADLANAFDESDLAYKVDVVDWANISESFKQLIQKDRILLLKV